MTTVIPASVLWFTGLSGSGKSTLATAVDRELQTLGVATELLDGDAVRALSPTGFSRVDRDAHVKRVGFLASRLEHHNVTVLCSLISPYASSREFVRSLCRRFIEIHVATPLAECERRDVKGLYSRARRGELTQFTGIDDPYEPPDDPELTIDTSAVPLDEAVSRVITVWERITADSPPVPAGRKA